MAAESLIGGVVPDGTVVSDETKALLDAFMTDTIGGTAVAESLAGGGFSVFGTGSSGELQGVVASGDVAVAAEVVDGSMKLNVTLPSGVSLGMQGLAGDVTPAKALEYLNEQITAAFAAVDPDGTNPAVQAYRASLESAVSTLLAGMSEKLNVKVVNINDNSGGAAGGLGEVAAATGTGNVISFDASSTSGTTSELLTFLMGQIQAGNTLELKGVSNALLIGDGSVVVASNAAAKVFGDVGSQKIVGGNGADTLVGGGGVDVLVGAGGNDTYGFNSGGNVTVVAEKGDNFAFMFDGLSLGVLLGAVTNVSDNAAGTYVEFLGGSANGGLSITLVGLHAADITADMIKFTI